MLHLPPSINGHTELETKILAVRDPKELEAKLRDMGAVSEGTFEITEQRYKAKKVMEREHKSLRLRRLQSDTRHFVEIVSKHKHPHQVIPGHEHLGPLLKHRTEYEIPFENGASDECRFQVARGILLDIGMKERDRIVTSRVKYSREGVHYELESVLSYNDETHDLPPTFLEIEGLSAAQIVEAAAALGYSPKDMSPLTKRGVIEEFRNVHSS